MEICVVQKSSKIVVYMLSIVVYMLSIVVYMLSYISTLLSLSHNYYSSYKYGPGRNICYNGYNVEDQGHFGVLLSTDYISTGF